MGDIQNMYAGFWRRLAAHLLDVLIFGIPYLIVFGVLREKILKLFLVGWQYPLLTSLLGYAIGIAVYVAFLTSRWQATPGKRIMGVFVGRASDGQRIATGQAAGRWLAFNLASLVLTVGTACMPSAQHDNGGISNPEKLQLQEFVAKQAAGKPLSAEEKQSFSATLRTMNKNNMKNMAHLSDEEAERWQLIQDKRDNKVAVSAEELSFEQSVAARVRTPWGFVLLQVLVGLYTLAAALMVGLHRQKAGIHDLIAGTRVFKGRTFNG